MTSEFGCTLSMMNTLPPMVLFAPVMIVFATENGRAGIDGHAILDGRMALLAAQLLAARRQDFCASVTP